MSAHWPVNECNEDISTVIAVAGKKSCPRHSLVICNQKGDTMRQSRSAVLLLVGLLWIFHGKGTAQNAASQSIVPGHVLSLDNRNSGQRMTATVGQPIQITLQTIGPGQYVSPQISSPAIRFVSAGYAETQNPGGPRQIYRFRAASEGEAHITIPHEAKGKITTQDGAESPYKDPISPFAVTIRVHGPQKP